MKIQIRFIKCGLKFVGIAVRNHQQDLLGAMLSECLATISELVLLKLEFLLKKLAGNHHDIIVLNIFTHSGSHISCSILAIVESLLVSFQTPVSFSIPIYNPLYFQYQQIIKGTDKNYMYSFIPHSSIGF